MTKGHCVSHYHRKGRPLDEPDDGPVGPAETLADALSGGDLLGLGQAAYVSGDFPWTSISSSNTA